MLKSERLRQLVRYVAFAVSWALLLAIALGMVGCASLSPAALNGNAAILDRAKTARQHDQPAVAAALIEETILAHPEEADPALALELGKDLILTDPARALLVLDGADTPAAPDPRAMNVRAVANDLLGRHAEAQQLYAEAAKIAPANEAIKTNIEISRRMIADENNIAAATARNKKVAATPTPRRAIKRAGDVPRASKIESTAAPTPFAERWRLL